ncbi:desmoglein-2.1-like [Synchiropus picturatus]
MSRGLRPTLFILLVIVLQSVSTFEFDSGGHLVRRKREWIPPPKVLAENEDHTKQFVAKIHSDFDNGQGNIDYFLEGIGANQYPFNVFTVDKKTGKIWVTKKLDREEYAMYNLSGVAKYTNGVEAERNIDIRFKVGDKNDNSPVFPQNPQPGHVKELSAPGTPVMNFAATDLDEPGNPNSQIKYTIVKQTPPDNMFSITKDGTIIVVNPMLDREKADQYTLVVKGEDLNGNGGNVGTGTVVIKVDDVNDNLPTLEKENYEGSIEENVEGIEVMRLKASDLDVRETENWDAVYEIVKGNEAKYFSIKTDPKTNEGILMIDKAVNYEDIKDLDLGIIVKNKAPPHSGPGSSATSLSFGGGGGGSGGGGGGGGSGGGGGGGGGGGSAGGGSGGGGGGTGTGGGSGGSSSTTSYKTYPVKIKVKNQPEGPAFDPKVKAIPISEGDTSLSIKDVIGSYPAIDQDTGKPAENVRYAKGSDPDNWLYIDPVTAEIKLNKKPDRESPFLVNGTYYAKVLCISDDMPSKTATGTVAIQVEDFNDHCPTLTSQYQTMCTDKDAVFVSAKDEDSFPNGPPFQFLIIPEGTEGKWQVEHYNDTAAILRARETLWPKLYKVQFLIKDGQGEACPEPQTVEVIVCTCEDGVMCGKRGGNGRPSKDIALGPAGIGLLLLGLLLLLLLPLLLLFCLCGGAGGQAGKFVEMPFANKAHLVNYKTEQQGENTEVPLLNMPLQGEDMPYVEKGDIGKAMTGIGHQRSIVSMDSGMNGGGYVDGFVRKDTWGAMNECWGNEHRSEFENQELRGGGATIYDGMALPHHVLGQYYTQKLSSENDNAVKDSFLVYDYEGQGSPVGSVGCCSLLESDNDLQFLDDLGPKFKTLAEVCGGKPIPSTAAPRPPSISHTLVSNVSTAPPLPSPPKPAVSTTETVVKEISNRSQAVKETTASVREGMAAVKTGAANKGQMFVLQQQQPVYYATTPVMQPVQYVVQPQVPTTVMLAKAPATNLQNMVLVNGAQPAPAQGMVLVNGAQPAPTQGMVLVNGAQTGATPGMVLVNGAQTGAAQGMVVQGPSVMSVGQAKGPGMMLVEGSGLRASSGNLIQAGNQAAAQTMMVVEGKVPAGSLKVLRGNQATVVQGGSLQPVGVSGSQRVMVVEGSTGSGGRLIQGSGGFSQKSKASGSQINFQNNGSMSAGSQGNVVDLSGSTVTTSPSYQKVVVKETFTEL